jgi:ATP-dependent Clp protease ATP-binding subunit ClpA
MLIATGVRVAVYHAIAEARRAGATQVDTRHLLIGLVAANDPATRGVWRQLGVDLPALRGALEAGLFGRAIWDTAMRHGAPTRAPSFRRPETPRWPSAFTADARRALSDALVRARRRDARALSSVHLLLSIAAHNGTRDGRGLVAMLDVDTPAQRETHGGAPTA